MSSKYAIHGDEQLDAKIDSILEDIASAVSAITMYNEIAAILLGGTYARGEGGAVKLEDGNWSLSDPFELSVFSADINWEERLKLDGMLKKIAAKFKESQLELNFYPAINFSDIPQMPFTLHNGELKIAHIPVVGGGNILDDFELKAWNDLPLEEMGWQLLACGTKMLQSRDHLLSYKSSSTTEIIKGMNIICEAVLLCADVYLWNQGYYSHLYQDKINFFQNLPQTELTEHIFTHYEYAANFKMSPYPVPIKEISRFYTELLNIYRDVLLDYYQNLMKIPMQNIRDWQEAVYYNRLPWEKRRIMRMIKNLWLNFVYIRKSVMVYHLMFRSPQVRFLLALPSLLMPVEADELMISYVGIEGSSDINMVTEAYLEKWKKFNNN